MWPYDATMLASLLGSHEMAVQIDVFDQDGIRAADIPFEDGTITATLLADVCRSGSFRVTRRLIDRGLLDPRRDRVRISTGVKGLPLIPIFVGRVTDTPLSSGGLVQVQVEDFGRDLVDARFEQPWAAQPGIAVEAEMRRLIKDVDPEFALDTVSARPGVVPPSLVWEENRAGALDELAASINCIWQSDRVGGFTLYPNPYSWETPPPTGLTLTDGAGGNLTSWTRNTTRDGVYNSITVLVERADNSTPMRITVRDESPASPYRWGGPFGKVNRIVRLQTPGGGAEARALAQRVLNQSLSLYQSWQLSTPHFPLLDPGDVIGVAVGDFITAQVVETISYPLQAMSAASIATRELRLAVEVDS